MVCDIWALTQESCDNNRFKTMINYSYWRHTWYNFLRLLNINVEVNGKCVECGVIPDIIVCGATNLEYQKKFATIALSRDLSQAVPYPKMS